MLVFGIATAVTTIHRVLPHAVSSLLSIERFQSQPPLVCVLEMINKVTYSTILSIFIAKGTFAISLKGALNSLFA